MFFFHTELSSVTSASPGPPVVDSSNAGPPSVHTDPKYKVRERKSRPSLLLFDMSSCNISLHWA